MKVIPVFMLIMGAVLIWCAVTDRNPIDVTKAVLTRKPIPASGSLSGKESDIATTPGSQGKSGLGPGDSVTGGSGSGGGGGGGGSF